MRVDLKQRMGFPSEIVTNKRPDIVIWSAKTKQAVLLELTVPWEERIEQAYERKNLKYQELVRDCQQMDGKSGSCCGSGLQWLCWTVNVESTESYRNYRSRQEKVDRVSVQRDRDSIFVVVEKKSRQMEDQ